MARLLVVEDDNSVRNTVVTFLELENYSVDSVSSTREALSRLRGERYDIVVSDIYLDERTGLDVLEAARSANPDCAVILKIPPDAANPLHVVERVRASFARG